VTNPKPTAILWELISRLADTTLTVRISGESGTGKKSIARLLSNHYPHKDLIYSEFNCKKLKLQSKAPAAQPLVSGSVETFLAFWRHLKITSSIWNISNICPRTCKGGCSVYSKTIISLHRHGSSPRVQDRWSSWHSSPDSAAPCLKRWTQSTSLCHRCAKSREKYPK
jgi:hypothetical protein